MVLSAYIADSLTTVPAGWVTAIPIIPNVGAQTSKGNVSNIAALVVSQMVGACRRIVTFPGSFMISSIVLMARTAALRKVHLSMPSLFHIFATSWFRRCRQV
jgi:hypothetical protein